MKLSDRLETVLSFVACEGTAADIGTDHGYVPIELVRRKLVKRALAMDVQKGPLSRAEKNVGNKRVLIEQELNLFEKALDSQEAAQIAQARNRLQSFLERIEKQ